MQRNFILFLASALLAGVTPAVHAASHPIAVPRDSFINRHVDTLSEMSRQVTLDPVVRRRLARHFHTSGPTMVRYIQENLILKKLPATRRYQVYCLSRSGREYTINARLLQGTPVFVLRKTGEPILKLACGNPMVSSLPPVVKTAGSEEALPQMAGVSQPTSAGPAKLVPHLASLSPAVMRVPRKPVVTALMPAVTKVAGGLYELPAASHRLPLGFLAGIPLAAGLLTHNGGSNGSSGTGTNTGLGIGTNTGINTGLGTNTGFGTNTGSNTGVTPVPEPSASAAFAVGGVGLVILLAGARRRRKTSS